jgi:hypothetical protein
LRRTRSATATSIWASGRRERWLEVGDVGNAGGAVSEDLVFLEMPHQRVEAGVLRDDVEERRQVFC